MMSSGPPVKRLKQSCLTFKPRQPQEQETHDQQESQQVQPPVETQDLSDRDEPHPTQPTEQTSASSSQSPAHGGGQCSQPEPGPSELGGEELTADTDLLSGHSVPYHAPGKDIPAQVLKSKNLHFQDKWYQEFSWLHYVPQLGGVVCFQCATAESHGLLKLESKAEPAFISTGFKNWKKGRAKFKAHESSMCHRMAITNLLQQRSGSSVTAQLHSAHGLQQEQNRRCLVKIANAVRFLLRQGLAHRGHEEQEGNFYQLLLMHAEGDQELKDWLARDTNWTHHQCVEDIHQLFANEILRDIVRDIRESGIFAVIVDGTQDVVGDEQESLCLRYVDESLQVHEEFVGFHKLDETTGKAISNMILDVLLRLGLDKAHLRGQTYDGAANMDGKYNGAQALIKEKCPLALHFRCAAHILNLVAERMCAADIMIRDALDWLNELGKLYKQSGKYKTKFSRIATEHNQESPSPNPSTLKPLCPTRFLCRCTAITSAISQYPAVLESLLEMGRSDKSNTAVRALGLYEKAMSGRTFLGLSVASHLVSPLEQLNKVMQARKQSITGIMECSELVLATYQHLRTEESFAAIFEDTEARIVEYGLDALKLPRIRVPPKRLSGPAANHQPDDAESFYRKSFFEVVDTAMLQISERFSKSEENGLGVYERLQSILIEGKIDEELIELYPELNFHTLDTQLKMFKQNFQPASLYDVRATLRTMVPETRALFPQVEQLLKLLLVCPVSSCEAERSFSALRRLKTWLRSSLTQKRLNWVAVCNVHKLRMDRISTISIARDFVQMNSSRKHAFGGF